MSHKTLKNLILCCSLFLGIFVFGAVAKAEGEIQVTETGKDRIRDLIADGEGGAFFAWLEKEDTNTGNIYAMRIDSEGKIIEKKSPISRMAYSSKKGKKGNYYHFSKEKFKIKHKKFKLKEINYWIKVTKPKTTKKVREAIQAGMSKKNLRTVKRYWKLKTNLNTVTQKNKFKLNLTFQYNNKDLKRAGLKEKNLALYYYNGETKT